MRTAAATGECVATSQLNFSPRRKLARKEAPDGGVAVLGKLLALLSSIITNGSASSRRHEPSAPRRLVYLDARAFTIHVYGCKKQER